MGPCLPKEIPEIFKNCNSLHLSEASSWLGNFEFLRFSRVRVGSYDVKVTCLSNRPANDRALMLLKLVFGTTFVITVKISKFA